MTDLYAVVIDGREPYPTVLLFTDKDRAVACWERNAEGRRYGSLGWAETCQPGQLLCNGGLRLYEGPLSGVNSNTEKDNV